MLDKLNDARNELNAMVLDAGPAYYINPASKRGDKINITNNYSGRGYGKHKIAAFDGIFCKHRRSEAGDQKQKIRAH
jgi:hypothetical protein